jgi:hypothetical protein
MPKGDCIKVYQLIFSIKSYLIYETQLKNLKNYENIPIKIMKDVSNPSKSKNEALFLCNLNSNCIQFLKSKKLKSNR